MCVGWGGGRGKGGGEENSDISDMDQTLILP